MCRVVSYLGPPMPLSTLLYDSDSSLVRQAYDPSIMGFMNLAGCGVAAWNAESPYAEEPLIYKDTELPMYDHNLLSLSRKFSGDCIIGHVRGANYFAAGAADVTRSNCHPFRLPGHRLCMAHNGGLADFDSMKFDLLEYIRPEIASKILGTTDSEWVYAVMMSQLDGPDDDLEAGQIADLVLETLKIFREVRHRRGIDTASGVNLFVSDGKSLVATRFTFDFGCYDGVLSASNLIFHSLWYTVGRDYGLYDGLWRMGGSVDDADAIVVASEPLTRDTTTWIEVPEYSMLTVSRGEAGISVDAVDLEI